MSGIVLGTGDKVLNKRGKNPYLQGGDILEKKGRPCREGNTFPLLPQDLSLGYACLTA